MQSYSTPMDAWVAGIKMWQQVVDMQLDMMTDAVKMSETMFTPVGYWAPKTPTRKPPTRAKAKPATRRARSAPVVELPKPAAKVTAKPAAKAKVKPVAKAPAKPTAKATPKTVAKEAPKTTAKAAPKPAAKAAPNCNG